MGIVTNEGGTPLDLAEEPAMKDLLLEQVKKQGEPGHMAGGAWASPCGTVCSRPPPLLTARACCPSADRPGQTPEACSRARPAALGRALLCSQAAGARETRRAG